MSKVFSKFCFFSMENLNVQKGKLFNFEKTYLNRK